jgi:hypothetical protein
MTLFTGAAAGIFVIFVLIFKTANGMNCDYPEEKTCLDVNENTPINLPKCYCTPLCATQLGELQNICKSGQLLPDECGICLKCAKTKVIIL